MSHAQLRIIDANANRAREGLRTAEDYVRFALGNHKWALVLKTIRKAVTDLVQTAVNSDSLLASRDVPNDPQRSVCQEELNRAAKGNDSSRNVALRGLKRAQEALRVLEEYTRSEAPSASAEFSQHRFHLYEAEQWLVTSGHAASILATAHVYILLTESLCRRPLMETAKLVLKGGGRLLQLRQKNVSDKALIQQASELVSLCSDFGAVLICNDRVDVALATGAAGVHLGQDDMPIEVARRISSQRLLIGRSTHSVLQASESAQTMIDYLGLGSIYPTASKENVYIGGLTLAQGVLALGLNIPTFAIGGIQLSNISELKRHGVSRVAVSSAIIEAPDPEEATRAFIEAMTA
jgi:thiamine-phosphate pyrophosphorylase